MELEINLLINCIFITSLVFLFFFLLPREYRRILIYSSSQFYAPTPTSNRTISSQRNRINRILVNLNQYAIIIRFCWVVIEINQFKSVNWTVVLIWCPRIIYVYVDRLVNNLPSEWNSLNSLLAYQVETNGLAYITSGFFSHAWRIRDLRATELAAPLIFDRKAKP